MTDFDNKKNHRQKNGRLFTKFVLDAVPTLVVAGMIALISFVTFYVYPHSSCSEIYYETGYLSGMKDEYNLILDNETFYVTDYFGPDRGMPVGFSKYFGHDVRIEYKAGCGRVMITDIEIL